jgi:hypothetical protein
MNHLEIRKFFVFVALSGVDVCQTVYTMLTSLGVANYLSSLQKFAILIAALMHDIDHPGLFFRFHNVLTLKNIKLCVGDCVDVLMCR